MNTTKNTQSAIRRYGRTACIKAYQASLEGYGASGILHERDCGFPFKTVGQVDAAINAGKELAKGVA